MHIPELLSEQNLPYQIETTEELKLYRRTCNETVRNIWLDTKAESANVSYRRRDSSPSVSVPGSCPPLLQLHRSTNSQPTYPTISDHAYHSELFPYHEHSGEQEHSQQWQPTNTTGGPQQAVYPQTPPECYGEWRGRQGSVASLLVLQRTTGQRNQRLQRPPQPYQQSVIVGQPQYQPHPILLSSDFPELPNRGSEPQAPSQMRRPFLPDPGNFTDRRATEIPELRAWLQAVYPQRAAEFSTMAALASRFEEVARRIVGRTGQQEVSPPQTDIEQLLVQTQTCQEGRRLYRDVVASKTIQEEDSETNIEVKFEELEREALEQYINSQNEIDEGPEVGICPEEEEQFLDLERQAIEQYEEQTEIEEQAVSKPIATEEPDVGSSGPMPQCAVDEEDRSSPPDKPPISPESEVAEMYRSSEEPLMDSVPEGPQTQSNLVDEPAVELQKPSSFTPVFQDAPQEDHGTDFRPQRNAEDYKPRPILQPPKRAQETRQKPKTSQPPTHRRKEPAPTPSCVRLPRRPSQETKTPGKSVKSSEKCDKRYGPKASRPSRPTASDPERCGRKGEEHMRKSFYKKKEPSPKSRALRNKKRPPPLTVVDKEVRTLANCLKTRILNYLKDVDVKVLTEEHSKVALRELLYKKQQKESIRKEVRVSDIQDTDTLRLYVREIAGLARQQMQVILKRVRDEVLDMTSKKTIFIAQPTTTEKRKVRYFIKKCLELMEKADSFKKMPKKPLESSKKEITDTLTTIHKTMDVVYLLRDMCRETYEDMEYLKSSRETVVELLMGQSFLEDKSDYIRQRVAKEKLSLLLYSLFPRRESVLYDRAWAKLGCAPHAIYMTSEQQLLNNTLLINHQTSEWTVGVKQMRVFNSLLVDRPRRKDLWSEDTWEKTLVVGTHTLSVDVLIPGSWAALRVPDLNTKHASDLRKGLEEKNEFQRKISLEEKRYIDENGSPCCTLKPPRKRKAGTKSDPELQSKQPALSTDRGYWTWPKNYKTSNLMRLLKTQPKQRKKPVVKNDSGCSIM